MSSLLDKALDEVFPGDDNDGMTDATHLWVAMLFGGAVLAITLLRRGLGGGAY